MGELVTQAMAAFLFGLCFSPGLAAKAPMEMGSRSTGKFYRIPEGKGPHTVGCTDLMTGDAVEVKLLVLSPLDLSHYVSETTHCSLTDGSHGRSHLCAGMLHG